MDSNALWLPPAKEAEWQASLRSTPAFTLTALLSFWALHSVLPRLMGRRLAGLPASTKLRWQHQIACCVHAGLSIAAALGSLLARYYDDSSEAGLFTADARLSAVTDAHAGFLLYGLIMYTRHAGVVAPPFPFVLLQHAALLACWAMAKVFPCSLTYVLLPYHQLGAVAALAHAWRAVAVMRGTGKRAHLGRLRVELGALALRVALAAAAAFRAWAWLRGRPLWTLLGATPDVAAAGRVYATLVLASSALLVLVYVSWMQNVLFQMANVPIIKANGGGDRAADTAGHTTRRKAKATPSGSAKKRRQS
ncbi:hypothetical protein ACKKBG_A15110 [Auxenochlorella protothecoides x Auxenochlorella symbiontica]